MNDKLSKITRLIIIASIAMASGMTSNAFADDVYIDLPQRSYNAVYLEGGVVPSTHRPSMGIGIKISHFGIVFGVANRSEVDMDMVSEFPSFSLIKTRDLGVKKTGTTYGFDGLYFYEPIDNFSIYGGPGLWFQEYRRLSEVAEPGYLPGLMFTEDKTRKLEISGSIGIQKMFPVHSNFTSGVVVGAGYHTIRGPSVHLGLAW
jgi:hypothetical protein